MKFKTLIFDMDGVITDTERLYDVADTEFFRRHGQDYNRLETMTLLIGRSLKEGVGVIKDKYHFEGSIEELYQERRSILEGVFESSLHFIDGFEEFFKKVQGAGLQSGVATASDDKLLSIADRKLGLAKLFGNRIYKVSDVGNKSKPDPAIFLYAAKQMHAESHECFVIEDSPRGIQAAKNAGMFCIGIATTFPRDQLSEADLVVDAFEEIDLEKLGD